MTKYECIECDMCGKKHEINPKIGYPYNEGWIYLYNLNLQKPTISTDFKYYRLYKEDRHFCRHDCIMRYFDMVLKLGDVK